MPSRWLRRWILSHLIFQRALGAGLFLVPTLPSSVEPLPPRKALTEMTARLAAERATRAQVAASASSHFVEDASRRWRAMIMRRISFVPS